MSQSKPLAEPADVRYLYDGSLAGFYTCVHESVYSRQIPLAIAPEGLAEPGLFPQKLIQTDRAKALKVRDSIPVKISAAALDLIETVFLSCLPEKEAAMLRFLLAGYQRGPSIMRMLGDPIVAPLLTAQHHLLKESQLLRGFIRFSDYDGVLAATISPKNFVLPFLSAHFVNRYPEEAFLIYDRIHGAALVYQNRHKEIIALEGITFPAVSETEQHYRNLWKKFYHTVAIKARENPKCRMNLMPKRYWENMTEMQELL